MSVADIADAKNIQLSTVLSYLAAAIAAGHAYAWDRFGVADSTLRSIGEAAAASDLDAEFATAATSGRASCEGSGPALPEAVALPDGAAAVCGFDEAPAGPADAEENVDVSRGGSDPRTSLLAATNTLAGMPVPGSEAVTTSQGFQVRQLASQRCGPSEIPIDTSAAVPSGCVLPTGLCAGHSAAGPLTASTAACIEDLILQRVSLRPLRERLCFDIDFGVLRLALAHLTRLSAQSAEESV
jgi:hypothetical protein